MNEKQPIPLRLSRRMGRQLSVGASPAYIRRGQAGRTATKLKASYCTRCFGGVHVLSIL